MDVPEFVVDLVLAAAAALVGGALAQRLGQPVILGYLLGGVAIGPFTPGPIAHTHSIEVLAEIGVAFLMFALGAELSIAELRRVGPVVAVGGAAQILGTMAVGPAVAPVLGLSTIHGVFLGGLLALSSTVVALKVLMARGELQALHGRVALGILVLQDLAVVPMVVVLPALAGGGADLPAELALAALKAAAVLLGAYVVGIRAVPALLGRAAVARSRELFLLGVVTLALGTALVTQAAGLSLAFGAFLAGLVVGQSDYRAQVVADALPFRDVFASLFFVSVGMLINPALLVSQAGAVLLLGGAVVAAKAAIVTVAGVALGLPGRVALLAGLSLGQVGEFSFVLARAGLERGSVPPVVLDLTLATALATIVIAPLLLRGGGALADLLQSAPLLGRYFAPPAEADPGAGGLRGHAIICGYGRVGRELAEALRARGFRYAVVEHNPLVVRELRRAGIPVVYGDAGNPAVLEHAHVDRAQLLALLMPDANAAELAARHARALRPDLDILARASDAASVARLRGAGATDVVQPEFEAGVEVVRHAMRRFGVVGPELTHLTAGRRAAFYRREA